MNKKQIQLQIETIKREIIKHQTNHENTIAMLKKEFQIESAKEAKAALEEAINEYNDTVLEFNQEYEKFQETYNQLFSEET